MTATLTCTFCGQSLDHTNDYYRQVIGWERPGRGVNSRSGSSIVLRNYVPDKVACVSCITRIKNQVDVNQETLL